MSETERKVVEALESVLSLLRPEHLHHIFNVLNIKPDNYHAKIESNCKILISFSFSFPRLFFPFLFLFLLLF